MAEYLIQDTTLDAIADAINTKKGGAPAAMTPAEMATAIGSISGGGGGGMSWELIADYTSDAAAEIVVATIPSGKQDSNVYRYQYNSNGVSLYYPYSYFNSARGQYYTNGSRAVNCVGYVTKKPLDGNSEVGGSAPPTAYSGTFPNAAMAFNGPFVNLGLQAYSGRTIPAGFNIKVWRLVES